MSDQVSDGLYPPDSSGQNAQARTGAVRTLHPRSVTTIGIIALISGILGILQNLYLLIVIPFAEIVMKALIEGIFRTTSVIDNTHDPYYLFIIGIIIGIGQTIGAVGILKRKKWAWWTMIIIESVNMLFVCIELILLQSIIPSVWLIILELIVPLVVVIYLLADKKVRTAFSS